VSEKSTWKAPDYAVESRAARNRSVFRPELQLCPCHTAEERYNLCEPAPKKEIPAKCHSGVVRAEFGPIHPPSPALFLRKFVRHEGLANAGQGFQQES